MAKVKIEGAYVEYARIFWTEIPKKYDEIWECEDIWKILSSKQIYDLFVIGDEIIIDDKLILNNFTKIK